MNSSFSHVALLVSSVEKSAAFLKANEVETGEPEVFPSEGTKEVYVGSYGQQSGLLLLLEAISDGPYRRAMSKRGPSLHHIAIDVLDVKEFVSKAQRAGWNLHQISAQSMPHNTAWLFLKGVPALIEVNQKKELSIKPPKVSRLEIPYEEKYEELFRAIGLEEIVARTNGELCLTLDGRKWTFSQIACLS